jgi:hypothetical protein
MNNDSITCFGYYQKDDALRWNSTNLTWEESEMTWAGAEQQAKVLEIIAGNQQGFVSILSTNISRNSASLQISDWPIGTATITCYNHNLKKDDYIYLEGPNLPALPTDPIHQVLSVTNKDTFEVQLANTVPYVGGWTMARISVIDILTKQYNFYASKGRNAQVNKVNFLVDTTDEGEVTIDYFTNASDQSLVEQGSITGSQTGTSVLETYPYPLYPYEATQERVWHPIYIDADGSIVQLRIYMTYAQMINKNRAFSDFQMHAMMFHAKPSSTNLF